MDRKQLISVFFIALLLYILYSILRILGPFMTPLFWGAMLAFAFYPVYERLLGLLKNNTNLSAVLATFVILLAFVPLLLFIVIQASREGLHFYDWLTHNIQDGTVERLVGGWRRIGLIQKLESLQILNLETIRTEWREWVLGSAGWVGNFALKHATILSRNIVTGVFNFFLTFLLIFFFLRDGHRVYRFIYEITPMEEDSKQLVFKQLSETFSATLRGQLFTALAQAGALGLVFWLLGLPLPIFFTAVAFLAAMIPVFGAATVWVPFSIYFGITQQFGRAALLTVLGIFAISGIDNILKPLLIGQKTKLPYSLLFLGILGGLHVYGFMGVFLAPAFFSLFFVLIKIYREKFSETA